MLSEADLGDSLEGRLVEDICFVIGSGGMLSDFGICLGESGGLMRVALATMFGEADVVEASLCEYRKIPISGMSEVDREIVRDYLLLVEKMGNYCESFRGLLNSLDELVEFHLG